MTPLGVYIHFPWCRTLCPYCDFPRERIGDDLSGLAARYAEAVLDELAMRADQLVGRDLVSIYFGGGSPSLWAAGHIGEIIDRVAGTFRAAASELEITLEANPRDCAPESLAEWRAAGVNRLSVGVQALVDEDLVTLGRDHDVAAATAALTAASAAGFDRLSADLILGVPGSSDPTAGFRALATAAVGHLSVYELTVKEATPLAAAVANGRFVPLDDDVLADRYLEADAALTGLGYQHYEISNYARPGQRAIHNALYWSGAEFLGLGVGAASFRRTPGGGGTRWKNLTRPADYLAARGADRVAEVEPLSADQLQRDLLWLGLRTSDGVAETLFAGFEPLVDELVGQQLLIRDGQRIRPTMRGFLLADRVAAAIVGAQRYTCKQRIEPSRE